MTFQLCRPATIKLLPYGGTPLGKMPCRICFAKQKQKTTASIEAVVYGGELGTRTPDPLRVMQVL